MAGRNFSMHEKRKKFTKALAFGNLRNKFGGKQPRGALHISLIDLMIDQKNAGIGYFFGVENRKILAFRVLFLGSVIND